MKQIYTLFALMIFATTAVADIPKVVAVTVAESNNTWRFNVSIEHADTGWDHYANGWGVYLEDGTELGYRVLAHPHVNEMPFTRSLSGVEIPEDVTRVFIRPRDSVHGEGELFAVDLP